MPLAYHWSTLHRDAAYRDERFEFIVRRVYYCSIMNIVKKRNAGRWHDHCAQCTFSRIGERVKKNLEIANEYFSPTRLEKSRHLFPSFSPPNSFVRARSSIDRKEKTNKKKKRKDKIDANGRKTTFHQFSRNYPRDRPWKWGWKSSCRWHGCGRHKMTPIG